MEKKTKRLLMMQCAMLLPTGIYALCLWYYGIPILALLTYLLIVTLVYPLIYIKFVTGKKSKVTGQLAGSMAHAYYKLKIQLMYGLSGFFAQFIVIGLILYGSLYFLDIWQSSIKDRIWLNDTEIIILSVLLCILHPILEEFFWRCFVQTVLVGGLIYEHPSELMCWYISTNYGLMHLFIFATFLKQFWMAIPFCVIFMLLGRLMIFFRDHGVLSAIISHTGLNIGIVTFINIQFWRNQQQL